MLLKVFRRLVIAVVPWKHKHSWEVKLERIENAVRENALLSFLIAVLFFPLTAMLSLIKILLILFLPFGTGELKYIIKQFYKDIKQDGLDKRTAWKRAMLTYELLTKGAEKYERFGEKNPDKTFYVIRPYYYMEKNELATSLSDLLFHYYRNLQQLSYALENNWIPVVDWENYGPFRHAEDYPINGTRNCWEYYWRQPSGYTLEEVYQSKNVVLANRNSVDYGYIPSMLLTRPYQEYAENMAKLCPKYDELFVLNAETQRYIDERQKETLPPNSRILGVAVRAMSYGSRILKNHPIQPRQENLVEEIKRAVREWDMDFIYFSCESADYINEMKAIFGDKLIVLKRRRYTKEPAVGQKDDQNELYMPGRKYQTNLDYLTEMVLLSRCDALLSSMTGGVRAAIVWNRNRYEHIKIIEGTEWEWRAQA